MADEMWFWARDKQRNGPVSKEQMTALIGRREIDPSDLVWTAGMTQWQPAGKITALSQAAGTSSQSAAAPAHELTAPAAAGPASEIGYYNPEAGMPPRAAATLRGHASPRGDTADWPLDDQRVALFKEAFKLRKRVTAAAGLYRLLLLLMIIADVFVVISAAGIFLGGRRSAGIFGAGMSVAAASLFGFSILYFFAWRATMRSQRWAPLTMFIVFVIGVIWDVVSMALGPAGPSQVRVGGFVIIVVIFGIAFAIVSWRSFAAIPRYLAQPAWCQELLVTAQL